ncbi:MAG: endonuclease/exonuclease/phosphatase family protein [Actinobacteria bacterium]|nr:endonuclease/exonuclease/phosphatase family protein [Actinomycetota bacterium]
MIHAHPRLRLAALALLGAALPALVLLVAGHATAKPSASAPKPTEVKVMTRNVYLGADLTPAIQAKGVGAFTEATGQILREVTANDFPVRAKGLAKEILAKEPDLVGLQEVAEWRTGPPSLETLLSGTPPKATTVRYDYLAELLGQLNKGKKRYRAVVVNPEFDFEAPADENGVPGDGPNNLIPNAEINGRLTMRDVILAKVGAGVKVSDPRKGHFKSLYSEEISGAKVIVTRGWASVDASVNGSTPFRFVDTHLESFDPQTVVPSIRAQQAAELVAPGGPATSNLPVILVGDLNSDTKTAVQPGDGQAYETLVKAGMRERSTYKPLGCCLETSLLPVGDGGAASQFNHKVDHIMTRDPKQVKLVNSSVTGRSPQNGFWDSDHAGLFSTLRIYP